MRERRHLLARVPDLIFTGYVAALLLLSMPPAFVVLLCLPSGRPSGRLLPAWAQFVIRTSGCRLTVEHASRLPSDRPAMLVANHSSYLDSVVLMAALPLEFRFVANHGLLSVPMVRTAVRKARYVTVNRGEMKARYRCLLDMAATLRTGISVLAYPEGTAKGGPTLLRFRSGGFRAAVQAGCAVVPITIRGTHDVWPYRRWLFHRGAMTVTIHEAIEPGGRARTEIARICGLARDVIEGSLESPDSQVAADCWSSPLRTSAAPPIPGAASLRRHSGRPRGR